MITKLVHTNGIELTFTSNDEGIIIEGIKFIPFSGSNYFFTYNGIRLETAIELLSADGFSIL
jgi:hypothetical protein